jgi:glycosyltransferase involved in cell wall biosynthesis
VPNATSSILRAATRRPDESLNILTFPTHERYESGLAQSGHSFYAYRAPGIKDWNRVYAPLPKNYTLFDQRLGEAQIPLDLDFDIVLSQNKFGQFPIAKRISETCHIPLISLEHTLPHPGWNEMHIAQLRGQKGHINIFLSEYSKAAWGWDSEAVIIAPGIDTEMFTPESALQLQPVILSVVNDWINRDWACGFNLWKTVTKDLKVMVLGDTPGLSKAARTTEELVATYRQCQVFLNTSLISTAPFTLLEAMACGSAVVSTASTMIPQIVQDGVNGFCSNDPVVLRRRCEQLLADPELCRRLGREARKTMVEKYSFVRMASDWDAVLRMASSIVVTG